MITIHHLSHSQSERIVWLCEEISTDYELKRYTRVGSSGRAPKSYQMIHRSATAPVIEDGEVTLAESGAIVEYIIARHSDGSLGVATDAAEFPAYLFWLHYANASLVPNLSSGRMAVNDFRQVMQERLVRSYDLIEEQLAQTPYFAGFAFSAADIMMVFPLTTMQMRSPIDLGRYPAIRSYISRVNARSAYSRAMRRADPDLPFPRIATGP